MEKLSEAASVLTADVVMQLLLPILPEKNKHEFH